MRWQIGLHAIVDARCQSEIVAEVIAGVHIEGPFLNPSDGTVGAHPIDSVCPADVDAMKRLLEAAGGLTRMVTLAPEMTLASGDQVTGEPRNHCLSGALRPFIGRVECLDRRWPESLHASWKRVFVTPRPS